MTKVDRLPRPGETVSGATLERIPGGKGANQAVGAARLAADVRMVGCVGTDPFAAEALVGLLEAGVTLDVHEVAEATGIALIRVADDGANVIVVVPGANARVGGFSVGGSVLCQLEIPDDAVRDSRAQADWLCVNAAPARPLPVDADLVVANRYEAEVVGEQRLIAITHGEEGRHRSRRRVHRLSRRVVARGTRGRGVVTPGLRGRRPCRLAFRRATLSADGR